MVVSSRGPAWWRGAGATVGVAVALALVVLIGTSLVAPGQVDARPVDVVVIAGVLLACAAWAIGRPWPALGAVLVAIVVAVYLVLGGPYGPIQLLVSLGCYAVGAHHPARRAAALAALVAALLLTGLGTRLGWTSPLIAVTVMIAWAAVFVAVPVLLGALVRVRAEATARQRRDLLARGAEAERLRVARDVHDIAGHGFAVVSMQAGVALTVFEEAPEQARRCLEAIRDSSTAALRDLQGMLDALRVAAPDADDVADLVDRVRAAGLPVDLHATGDAGAPMDQEVSATVHRVVQEALTNVLRHAGAATAGVAIHHDDGTVVVSVSDRGRGLPDGVAPAGRGGLTALRHRAEELGGTLAVADRPEGGVVVTARLPRRAQR